VTAEDSEQLLGAVADEQQADQRVQDEKRDVHGQTFLG
jgi:hypothetical protein